MSAISYDTFTAEVLSLYAPPMRSRRTRSKMRQVLGELATLGVATTAELTPATVARFVQSRASGNPNTTLGLLGYVRAACGYAVARGYLAASPFAARKAWLRPRTPTAPKHHPRAEIARLLAHLKVGAIDWAGHRLFALASVWAYTGLRRDEALRLKVEDVDLQRGFLFVRPRAEGLKTPGSEAPVPCPAALLSILKGWLPRCGSEWVFPGIRRKGPWTGGPGGQRAGDRLRRAAEAIGLKGLTPHTLRHSLATHLIGAHGLSREQVRLVLRHTHAATQDHYIHSDLINLRAAVRGFTYTSRPPARRRRVLPRKRFRRARRAA